jgi:hypothetical protein
MTEIDRRVRILTDILMDRGFGWLAAEIIETIEGGRNNANEEDTDVESQRSALNQRLLSGDANAVSTPEDLKYSATRPETVGEPLDADDQILVAVALFIDRLSSAAEMPSKSQDELNGFMDTSVSLFVETEGEVRSVRPAEARHAALQLRGIKGQLVEWLLASSPEDG